MARRRRKQPVEYSILLTAILCLIAFGVVMVYSASSATSFFNDQGDSSFYLKRHLMFVVLGLIALRLISRRGLTALHKLTPALLVATFVLLIAVAVPGLGRTANGAQRWLGAGPLQIQPAELAKLVMVLYAAQLFAKRPSRAFDLGEMAKPLLVVVGIICLLILKQPDLGTALVIALTIGAMLVVAGVRLRHLAFLGASASFLALVAILIEPYRRDRLIAFLHPAADAAGTGYQSLQGMIALGSGGLFGVGLGESVQKVFYLPEAHTDMVLAVIGEELGLLGVLAVLFLYGLIAYAGFRCAKAARDRYSGLLAAGITSLILTQATLNFGAVLGLVPVTGVPLPLVSYGGSNLVVLLVAMGLLLNVAAGGRVSAGVAGRRSRGAARRLPAAAAGRRSKGTPSRRSTGVAGRVSAGARGSGRRPGRTRAKKGRRKVPSRTKVGWVTTRQVGSLRRFARGPVGVVDGGQVHKSRRTVKSRRNRRRIVKSSNSGRGNSRAHRARAGRGRRAAR